MICSSDFTWIKHKVSVFLFIYKVMCCGGKWIIAQEDKDEDKDSKLNKYLQYNHFSLACIELSAA